MNQNEIREVFLKLEIKPTKDKNEIKKAYAEKAKTVHPEDDQEEWSLIYDAYKKAILWSDEEEAFIEPAIKQYRTQEVNDTNFEAYLEMINSKQKEMNENLNRISLYLNKVSEYGKISYFKWKQFFKLKDYQTVCFHPDFMVIFNKKISHIIMSRKSKALVLKELEVIWAEWEVSSTFSPEEEKGRKKAIMERTKYLLDVACVEGSVEKDYGVPIFIIFVIAVIILYIASVENGEINGIYKSAESKQEVKEEIRYVKNVISVTDNIDIYQQEDISYEYIEEDIPAEFTLQYGNSNEETKISAFSICTSDLKKEEYGNVYALITFHSQMAGRSKRLVYIYNGDSYVEAEEMGSSYNGFYSITYGYYHILNNTIFLTVPLYEKGNTHPVVIVETLLY